MHGCVSCTGIDLTQLFLSSSRVSPTCYKFKLLLTRMYIILTTVGILGAYGQVWKCLDKEIGQMVAMKRFKEVRT